eukprot:12524832-Alexandrium_andersonii.AAC.1
MCIRDRANTVAPHSLKPFPDLPEVLAALARKYPGDWDTVEENWEEFEEARSSFIEQVGMGYTQNHTTAAAVLALSKYPGTDFHLKDVFKVAVDPEKSRPTLAYYDWEAQHWRTRA